jgi:IS30 family transposase
MAAHVNFKATTGVAVCFSDPHSPGQRGTNGNTKPLLRQYLSRSTDLTTVTGVQLDRNAAELNERPREELDWRTPAEQLNQRPTMTR